MREAAYCLYWAHMENADVRSAADCIKVRDAAYAAAADVKQLAYKKAVEIAKDVYDCVVADAAAYKAATAKTTADVYRAILAAAIGNKLLSLEAAAAAVVTANQAAAAATKAAAAKALEFETRKVHAALNAKYLADHASTAATEAYVAAIKKADQDFAECIKRRG